MDAVVHQVIKSVLGDQFITALGEQAFDRLQAIFGPQVRFRALVPSRLCEGSSAGEAVSWLRRWFGDADDIRVLQSSASRVFDRLHMSYRLRVHDVINGWRVIEQQAYCSVQDGQITDLWLICSGFRPDNQNPEKA